MNRKPLIAGSIAATLTALSLVAPLPAAHGEASPAAGEPQQQGWHRTTSAPSAPGADLAISEAPVADAAMHGDRAAVRALLGAGADVNVPHNDGMTALHWAAVNDQAEVAEMLLYAGAHVDARTRLGNYTPVHMAGRAGSNAVLAILLDAGADATTPSSPGGATPLHLGAADGNPRTIELLLEHGAEVDALDEAWGQTPLMYAAAEGRVDVIERLVAAGADVSVASEVIDVVDRAAADREETSLRRRQEEALRAAEEEAEGGEESGGGRAGRGGRSGRGGRGAGGGDDAPREKPPAGRGKHGAVIPKPDPTETSDDNETATEEIPAEAAREVDNEEDADVIAAAKNAGGKQPERPPSYAELVGGHGGLTALLYAAREGHVEAAMALLDAGADIDRVSGGDHTSPLMIAVLNGHFDLAMQLLERGASPKIATDAGTTPLYGALNVRWGPRSAYPQQNAYRQQETGYLELMTALLERGARTDVRLEKHLWYTSFNFDHLLNSAGATPFWRAAYALDVEAMRLLVAHGADPNIPTRKLPSRGRPRPQGEDGNEEEELDPSGLPPVPVGGPAVFPLHAASGAGYGEGFAGYAHQHAPDGWLPAVRYLVEELGADVNARDHNGYNAVHHAAARGDDELIVYLIKKGADPHAVSRRGQTTVDMANGPVQRIQPYPRAIALLEYLGVKNNHACVSC